MQSAGSSVPMSGEMLQLAKEVGNTLNEYELCAGQAAKAKKLAAKLEHREVTLAVIGQFKRGKTTLINRILDTELLPTGIVPITAAVTSIRCGEQRALVWLQNGLSIDVPPEELHRYISEQENRNNERKVAEVEMFTPADFLRGSLRLVDTPGVGSVHENNSHSAYHFAEESDGVIFMLSVDSPINQIEIDFLRSTRRFAGRFYFIVNKTDTVGEKDLEEYLAYCNDLLCRIMEIAPNSEEAGAIRLLPVSAKTGAGVEKLKKMIREDLLRSSGQIMERSVGLKLLEILDSAGRQIRAYREVLKMAPNVFRRCFNELHRIMQERRKECERLPETDADGGQKQYRRAQLNEEKILLIARVKELFGIDMDEGIDRSEAAKVLSREAYAREYTGLLNEVEQTMNTVFMYKEENAYTVARRIEDLNILLHKMEKYRRQIRKVMA